MRLLIILLGLLLFTQPMYAQSENDPPDYGVRLCSNAPEGERSVWDTSILLSLSQILQVDGADTTVGVTRRGCRENPIDATCFAAGNGIQCQVEALERIYRAATWYAFQYREGGVTEYDLFFRKYDEAPAKAFLFADGAKEDDDIENFASAMVRIDQRPSIGSIAKEDEEDAIFHPVFRGIADLAMTALLGHEAGHLNNETCPIAEKSWAEENGLLSLIIKEHLGGELFCKRSLEQFELKADVCAMRWLRRLVLNENTVVGDDGDVGSFVRRSAADIISFQALTGWGRFDDEVNGKYTARHFKGYLGPAYRQILLASELNGTKSRPRICGNAASMIVQGVQADFTACEGGGEVSDPILALMPPGVQTAWNGGEWSRSSYSCRAVE